MHQRTAELEAIDLMILDLRTWHEEIRHKAAWKCCRKELDQLQKELIAYLETRKSEQLARQKP
ncbi:MAG: hypothetical protein ERJ67_00315 [Aphanocapsa feldmannii 277cV]|uniref:Uncharacterized protein n=2 Tax=Aphanocapsa feldmannii TaxID=192050 RepID=A0A524RR72_9CHRO|nr:MAG: hypothetical protein ERJ69_09765 [Aphanocapsa feldmannii 288cV]TGG96834.1 MAG: hypothetical protein ERJ67_00315 [Aphanocapsa feldmannii 277cV]TGH26284.1 MAG: hypothetical protein ERJ68_02140 [Aphanocapsa feldmannii 277cI]